MTLAAIPSRVCLVGNKNQKERQRKKGPTNAEKLEVAENESNLTIDPLFLFQVLQMQTLQLHQIRREEEKRMKGGFGWKRGEKGCGEGGKERKREGRKGREAKGVRQKGRRGRLAAVIRLLREG